MQDSAVYIDGALRNMLETGYYEVLPNVYVNNNLDLNIKMYRYLRTCHLLEMLQTQRFYIAHRPVFSDRREKGYKENLSFSFAILPRGDSEYDEKSRQTILLTRDYAKNNVLISCWTKDQYKNRSENYLKWKSFGEGYCRIESTLTDFLHSMDFGNMKVIIAPIQYKKEGYDGSLYDLIFTKTLEYEDEQEIRICLFPAKTDVGLSRFEINNIDRMIHGVTLSPFISRAMNNMIKGGLESKFPFLLGKIQLSKLAEY